MRHGYKISIHEAIGPGRNKATSILSFNVRTGSVKVPQSTDFFITMEGAPVAMRCPP